MDDHPPGRSDDWFLSLAEVDADTANQITAAIDLLAEAGPSLGRPVADTIKGSKIKNLKELRPGFSAETEIRILFAFDPQRQAVLLVGGDKSGRYKDWYIRNVPVAEERYERWLKGEYDTEEDD